MLRLTLPALAALACLLATPALATWNEPHVEGMQPHPVVPMFPDARVEDYSQKRFDSAEMVIAYQKGGDPELVKGDVEGRITFYRYVHKPGMSPLEIVRQWELALNKAGFETIVAGRGDRAADLCFDFEACGAFRMARGGQPAAYAHIWSQSHNDDYAVSEITIAEIKAMVAEEFITSDKMFDELERSGRVAIHNITFDTGKATLRPESAKVLAEVKSLLSSRPALTLTIEGHTDNVGNDAENQRLSGARAEAVKAWLVGQGIAAERLKTAGFGASKPVAANTDDAGRARNRRVELVRTAA